MTNFSDNVWAREMGIDLELLRSEDPSHPSQVNNRKAIMDKSEKFWAWNRFVQSFEYSAGAIYLNTHAEDIPINRVRVVKNAKKRAKMKDYVFTDAQLEIARRSLNAGGSV